MVIHPIILCGGSGTRLWPLSRKSYPKQFVPITGSLSLFQQTAQRLANPDLGAAAPIIMTGAPFRFVVTEQLDAIGIAPGRILIEPAARNTAPAILAAAIQIAKKDPAGLMLVCPSDHVISDPVAFSKAVLAAQITAASGQIVTFGIRPTRPETGYGYLKCTQKPRAGKVVALEAFVEKPNPAEAQNMLKNNHFLWNSGIFLFRADVMISAFRQYLPDHFMGVQQAMNEAERDLRFCRIAKAPWQALDDISIDYGIMEKSEGLSVMPLDADWSDLGDWCAIWRHSAPDETGTAVSTGVTAIDCSNTLLRSQSPNLQLVGIGLNDVVAVAMNDAVLIAHKDRTQDVKAAVDQLKLRGAPQAVSLPVDHRPWGAFECLAKGDRFQVKRINVQPGAALSLQSHMHRAEHWIVVQGTARVTIEDRQQLVYENQSIYVPLGATHRLENPGKVPVILIEVQTGSYLGEDDITRYEDVYARSTTG